MGLEEKIAALRAEIERLRTARLLSAADRAGKASSPLRMARQLIDGYARRPIDFEQEFKSDEHG